MSLRWVIIFVCMFAVAFGVRHVRQILVEQARQVVIIPAGHRTIDAGTAFRAIEAHSGATTQPSKQWLADFAQFQVDHPGRWIVGRSQEPCLSEEEAIRAARADAAGELHAFAHSQWVLSHLDADALAGVLQSDYQAEKFDRPYGTVWAASVLVDASPAQLAPHFHVYADQLRRFHRRQYIFIAAGLVFVLGVWFICLLFNFATKGYFTAHLRLVAVMAVAAVIVMLI